MKKTVRITETELITIIKNLVIEQSLEDTEDKFTLFFKNHPNCESYTSNFMERGLELITKENYNSFSNISNLLNTYIDYRKPYNYSDDVCLFTNGDRIFTTVGITNDEGDYMALEIIPNSEKSSGYSTVKPKDMYSKKF